MANIKKPDQCDNCYEGTKEVKNDFKHLFNPERWICNNCEHVQVERAQRNDPNKCRECQADRDSKPFKKGKNQCLECFNDYQRGQREKNPKQYREYRAQPKVKKSRQAAVRKANQRDSKAFVRYLMHHITKLSNYKQRADGGNTRLRKGGSKGMALPVTIDFEYLWSLYNSQGGRCALSHLPMVHVFNDLCSISVDRVSSDLGYTRGNVQLVCKWVNLAKGSHGNEEFLGLIDNVRAVRT